MRISELGIFDGKDAIRVLWLGLSGGLDILQPIAGKIDTALADIGFPPEKRVYTPHVTIGQDIIFKCPFKQIRESIGQIEYGPIHVNKVTLFKSEQIQNRRIYSKVSDYGFTPRYA